MLRRSTGLTALRKGFELKLCSAALYGHLNPGSIPSLPHTGVDMFRVWPPPAHHRRNADLQWVLSQIERGELRFTGAADNPALDILAVRPNMTQKVGVIVTGRAQAPHVELYSQAGLSEAETLSYLVLGRSSSGGGAETALLQRAAAALLSGRRKICCLC